MVGAQSRSMDVSSRAGLLLGAVATGASFQPNLLSRATRDQAIISGVAASTGYAWGSTAHSLLGGIARRFSRAQPGQPTHPVAVIAVDTAAAVGGVLALRAMPPREQEPSKRAVVRLAAQGLVAAAAAGVAGQVLGLRAGRRGNGAATAAVALGAAAATFWLTRPEKSTVGALNNPEGVAHEDVVREVNPTKALASSLAVTAGLVVVAKGESALTGAMARGAAKVLGGDPADHRMLGRLAAAGATAGFGWGAVTLVSTMLARGGEGLEPAHALPPSMPEVTGGPGSLSSWADQSRESRRWLSMVLTPEEITGVMGEPAQQPIRVYGALHAATTPEERAALLLAEIDRTRALQRKVFVLFSPTGSGYVNYVASETLEYLTRGDCASACIQYSVLPSALSITKVPYAADQTRIVMNGIVERLMAMPKTKRPKFYLFGESLGSQVSEEAFRGQGMSGPEGIGLDAALWIGTPAATIWRRELWGTRTVSEAPGVGPGAAYLPRAIRDWRNLPEAQKAEVRFLLLQNGDDPIPKFDAPLAWKRPDWLCSSDARPPGSPLGTFWMPVVTFIATFIDMQNALMPTPGTFQEGGHDYRREIPDALRRVYRLSATQDQMERVQAALRARELEWETRREWMAAESKPVTDRAKAESKVQSNIAKWTGRVLDAAGVAELAGVSSNTTRV